MTTTTAIRVGAILIVCAAVGCLSCSPGGADSPTRLAPVVDSATQTTFTDVVAADLSSGGEVVLGCSDGTIAAVSPSGSTRWTAQCGNVGVAQLHASDDGNRVAALLTEGNPRDLAIGAVLLADGAVAARIPPRDELIPSLTASGDLETVALAWAPRAARSSEDTGAVDVYDGGATVPVALKRAAAFPGFVDVGEDGAALAITWIKPSGDSQQPAESTVALRSGADRSVDVTSGMGWWPVALAPNGTALATARPDPPTLFELSARVWRPEWSVSVPRPTALSRIGEGFLVASTRQEVTGEGSDRVTEEVTDFSVVDRDGGIAWSHSERDAVARRVAPGPDARKVLLIPLDTGESALAVVREGVAGQTTVYELPEGAVVAGWVGDMITAVSADGRILRLAVRGVSD